MAPKAGSRAHVSGASPMASDSDPAQKPVASTGLRCWVLFEWARNPYVLVITIYIYATYFTRDIVGDPVRGQALWAAIQGYAGLGVAGLAPFLGAIADPGGRRNPRVAVLPGRSLSGHRIGRRCGFRLRRRCGRGSHRSRRRSRVCANTAMWGYFSSHG